MKRRENFKRTASVMLAALLAVASLSGCGSEDAKKTAKADGSVNASGTSAKADTSQTDFKVMSGIGALSEGYDKNTTLKKMEEDAGISIEWNAQSDSLSEQVNVQIAGGDLPDAFMGVGFSNYDLQRYGKDGTFIDLTPYITSEYMPNLSKILEEHPDIKAAITMSDGKIYGLPAGEQMTTKAVGDDADMSIYSIPQYSMINKKWLDEVGLPVPTTLDELHTALKAFKDHDCATDYGNPAGSTIPMSTGFDQWCWGQNIFYAGFGFTNWPNDVISDLNVDKDGKVDFVSDNDNYRDAITYFHDWYAEGLIDQETFSQDDTKYMAKCQQGQVGVATWWYIDELMGDHAKDYVFLPVLDGPDGKHNVTLRSGGAINSGNLSVTSACKSPANILKFYDEWYAPENTMQLQYGPIGTYFTEKDDKGVWKSITEDESKEKYGKSAGELKGQYEVYGPKLILGDYYNNVFELEDRAVERLTDLKDFWLPYAEDKTSYPIDCVFTEDELDVIDTYKTDFEDKVSEYEAKWLKDGAPSDDDWNAYCTELKDACGMEELQKVYQDAYDRYKSAE